MMVRIFAQRASRVRCRNWETAIVSQQHGRKNAGRFRGAMGELHYLCSPMDAPYTSGLLGQAADELAKLPGIGRKSALRLALHLLKMDAGEVDRLAGSLTRLRHEVRYCRRCHNLCDGDLCALCSNPSREQSLVCVVENFADVAAIEATSQFHGLYHVLGGLISPIDGVGPSQLQIGSLVERAEAGGVKEVLLALSATMEGETTAFFIHQRLRRLRGIEITTLARGISEGDELQYTDELTLGRSIAQRIPFTPRAVS